MNVLFWTVFAAGTLLGLLPIWATDILPLLDAASHLHLITIIHEHGRNALYQHHYAKVDAIVPYLTYYAGVDWLAYIGGVEWANKVVLSASLGALPLAALHLIRTTGHSRWLVIAIFPWMLNADFFMGFFNYLMSIPVFLWVLAEHIRFMRGPTWKRGAWIAILLIFMAITHYLLWGLTLALLPQMALIFGGRHGWRQTLTWPIRELFIVLPSLLVLMPWFLDYFVFAQDVVTADQAAPQGATMAERLRYLYAGEHLTPVGNIKQIFDRLFDQFAQGPVHVRGVVDLVRNRPGEVVTSLWLLGFALWLMGSVKDETRVEHDAGVDGTVREQRRLEAETAVIRVPAGKPAIPGTSYAGWALGLLTVAYFLLPAHLNRPIILYGVNFRLIEVLGLLAVCALPVNPLQPPRHVRWRVWSGTAAMSIAAVMMPLVTAGMFMMARTEYGSIRDAMSVIPPGKRVLTLRAKRESRWLRNVIFSNVGEYYAIMRHGYVPYSFADSSSKPVVARREHTIPAPLWYDHNTYSLKQHGRLFDYVVIYRQQGEKPGRWEGSLRGWHRVYQRDRWQVYRNPKRDPWPEPGKKDKARLEFAERSVELMLELVGLDRDPDYPRTADAIVATLLHEDIRLTADAKRDVLLRRREAERLLQQQALFAAEVRAGHEAAGLAGPPTPIDHLAPGAIGAPEGPPAPAEPDAGAAAAGEPDTSAGATGQDLGMPRLKAPIMPTMPMDTPPSELLNADPAALQRAMAGQGAIEGQGPPAPKGPSPPPRPGTAEPPAPGPTGE